MNAPAAELDLLDCPLDRRSLIEASAGTGKTWSLCVIYLRLLLERDLAVEQILVVTFTTAATAELRARIRGRLDATLRLLRASDAARPDADPFERALIARLEQRIARAVMIGRIETALRTFDEASIHTIHGFCQRALADAPFVAGMPLAMTLAADDRELPLEVAQDFWRREVAGHAIDADLTAYLQQRRDAPDRLGRLLQRHLAKPLARCLWPLPSDVAMPDAAELAHAYRQARDAWLARRGAIIRALRDAHPPLHRSHYAPHALEQAARDWEALFAADDPRVVVDKRSKAPLFGAGRIRKTRAGELFAADPFHELADAWLQLRSRADDTCAAARLQLLQRLATDGPAEVRRRRRQSRVVSFDDMLYNLYQRLASADGERLAATLRARWPAALVDEFQDTDPLQYEVLQAIYPGPARALLLLGDPKQAIYGFRNADLHTYLRAKQAAASIHALSHNQRAVAGLVAALNGLFGANPRAFLLDGIDYVPARAGARPRPELVDRTQASPAAALQVWMLPDDEGGGKRLARAQAQHAAVEATAAEIGRLIAAGREGRVTIDGVPLRARDLAVLVRTHAEGDAIKRALSRLRIGSVELSQASVFASIDAEEVDTVLRAVLDPGHAPSLRAALATELVGWDVRRLEELAHDDARQLEVFGRFADYRDAWRSRGVGNMFRGLLAREQAAARLLARDDGERRLTNLLHLGECLQQAARQHPDPEALLRWLQAQRRDPPRDEALQLRLESDQNLVQIVTIHKSKGLEYPIVFCPFLWGAAWQRPPSGLDGREYHDDEGAAVIDYTDPNDAVDGVPVDARIRLENAAEDMRLIYVAATRAVHRCYLVAGSPAGTGARNLLNWLVAGAGTAAADWLPGGQKSGQKSAQKSGGPDAAAIDRAWHVLSQRTPQVGLAPLPRGATAPLARDDPDPATLVVRAPPPIPFGWRIGSYSSLTSQVDPAAAASAATAGALADHDARTRDRAAAAMPPGLDEDDILRFPRGARAGDTLHAVLERADLSQPATWPAAVAAAFEAVPLPRRGGAADPSRLQAMALRMLQDLARTPLTANAPGLRMDGVPKSRRLVELEFVLPAGRVSDHALNRTLEALGYPVPPLVFHPLAGYLSGFIDLVFERDQRFYLVDWKSNHLGYRPADYGAESIAATMVEHAYHLQYLLYTVALDRYLRRRVAGYAYERHFGGVYYLFVRGVRPGWRDAGGAPSGVYFDRPPAPAIARLEGLIAGEAAR
jgi:exodeoxyribonuclease V beta subunit